MRMTSIDVALLSGPSDEKGSNLSRPKLVLQPKTLLEQMDLIFSFRPSTVAGVAALLKYISTLEDWQMPAGLEESNSMKAVKTLCTSLAAAIEQSEVRA